MKETKLQYGDWMDLRSMLKHGDMAMIARKKGVSRVTVYRCLNGENDRHGILEYTLKLIKDRLRLENDAVRLVKLTNHR